jgi:hypothetical protein
LPQHRGLLQQSWLLGLGRLAAERTRTVPYE